MGAVPQPALPQDLPQLHQAVRQAVLDEFVLTQAIPIHMHKESLACVLERVLDFSNPISESDEQFIYSEHPAKPWIQLVYSVPVRVLDLHLLPVAPGSVSFPLASAHELELDQHPGITDHAPVSVLLRMSSVDPFLELPRTE